MFTLSDNPIEGRLLNPDAQSGAIAIFEGRVRNFNDGKSVRKLEYEAYEDLALKEGERILAEAKSKFEIHAAACVHRVGILELGEVAIRVEVASGHRRAAFRACEWIVDEIKKSVPIWKKEHYEDGDSGWLNCDGAGMSGKIPTRKPQPRVNN